MLKEMHFPQGTTENGAGVLKGSPIYASQL